MRIKNGLKIICTVLFMLGVAQTTNASYVSEIESNDTFTTAQNVDAFFTLDDDPNIFYPTTFYHASVEAAIVCTSEPVVDDTDFYKFTVSEPGIQGFFDVDDGPPTNLTPSPPVDTMMALFDPAYNLLAWTAINTIQDNGSSGPDGNRDPFVGIYTFASAGTYYIGVARNDRNPTPSGTPVGTLTRPDGSVGGTAYAGDSGPSQMIEVLNPPDLFGRYTVHLSLGADPVPIPTTILLLGTGLIGIGAFRRKKFFKK